MYIQFCFAVFISAAAFATSKNNENGLSIVAVVKADYGVRRNQTERTKGAVSDSDRDTILNTFNYQRTLVGASNMNYLSWSSSLENDVNDYLKGCNFDVAFKTITDYSFILKRLVSKNDGHKSAVEHFFAPSNFTTWVTSSNLWQVSGGYMYCRKARFEGKLHFYAHLYAYGISASWYFFQNGPFYAKGNACTSCYGTWCYKNSLCRSDCTVFIDGCCPIAKNVPDQCESFDLESGVSSTEAKVSIAMLVGLIASAFNS